MTQTAPPVNTIAPLQNVSRCMAAIKKVMESPDYLSHIVAFYGRSGYGKSTAAAYVANHFQAYYVEAKETWSRSAFLDAILFEMGIKPEARINDKLKQVARQLSESGKPLLIDEFGYIIKRQMVNVVRDIYDSSGGCPIMAIGEDSIEEDLYHHWEKFHNRVLEWVPAVACDLEDARLLRKLYCSKVNIADDLLKKIVSICQGNISRICINLWNIQEHAIQHGKTAIDLADWGDRPLSNGRAPKRRT